MSPNHPSAPHWQYWPPLLLVTVSIELFPGVSASPIIFITQFSPPLPPLICAASTGLAGFFRAWSRLSGKGLDRPASPDPFNRAWDTKGPQPCACAVGVLPPRPGLPSDPPSRTLDAQGLDRRVCAFAVYRLSAGSPFRMPTDGAGQGPASKRAPAQRMHGLCQGSPWQ